MGDFYGNFDGVAGFFTGKMENNRTSTDELLPNMSRWPITGTRSPLTANDRRVNNEMTIVVRVGRVGQRLNVALRAVCISTRNWFATQIF